MATKISDLVFSWGDYPFAKRKITVFDTTLRDGLQSPHPNRQPSLEEKKSFIKAAQTVGIEAIEIGFPVASVSHRRDVIELAKYAHQQNPHTKLSCLARTTVEDIQAVAEISQASGLEITANILIGSSKIRRLVETWNLPKMVEWVKKCIQLARNYSLPVEFVTEDGTRTDQATLKKLYKTAIDQGVKRVWIADTVGITTPPAAQKITSYFKKNIIGRKRVGLDWHGHDDRGLGVANSLAAAVAGADRIQATALAIGERAGNTSMESVIINLNLAGANSYNLDKLKDYSQLAAKIFCLEIPRGYPGVGKYVFSTAAGMHAAAINKASKIKRPDLEGLVYCPFHPSVFSREIDILIGPMSGRANVEWVLSKLDIKATDAQIEDILSYSKQNNIYLSHEEVKQLLVSNH